MAVIPLNFERSLFTPLEKFLDFGFPGFDLEDMVLRPQWVLRNDSPRRCCPHVQNQKYSSNKTTDYKVNLDVKDFRPEEITLKVIGDNTISIDAKHEEGNEDEHVYRHLVRKFTLPEGYDINKIRSKLSADGKLVIAAPKIEEAPIKERTIPIEHDKEIENNSSEKLAAKNNDEESK